jgi:putative transposase
MILNRYGEICQENLLGLPKYHNVIEIDTFKIMPNHVHVVIVIHKNDTLLSNGQALGLSLHNQHISLSKIMRDFKSFSSREINKIICKDNAKPCPILFKWQRSFYDHVIRNDKSLNKIREYIINNPINWANDEENINCLTNQCSEFLPAPSS